MNQIINIVKLDVNEIEIKGKKYLVNDGIRKLAKKIYRLYFILIGIMCVIGDRIAMMIGFNGFLEEMTVIIVLLVIFNVIMDYIVKMILLKKVA